MSEAEKENFVVPKRKTSLLLPTMVMDEFDELARPFGGKRKWAVFTVAVLEMLQMPPEKLKTLVRRIGSADYAGVEAFEELIQLAKTRAREESSGGHRPKMAAKRPPDQK